MTPRPVVAGAEEGETVTDQPVPRAGDFLLTNISGWVGAAVRFGQFISGDGWSPYQHSANVVDDLGNTVEAMPGGARWNNVAHYDPAKTLYVRVHMDEAQRWAVANTWAAMMGPPPVNYSYTQYAALALLGASKVLHLPRDLRPRWLLDYIADSGRVICSQYTDTGFAYTAGVPSLFDDGREPGEVSPADLYGQLTAQHVTFRYPVR